MALGISLVIGGAVNIVPIAAIFISNFQERFVWSLYNKYRIWDSHSTHP
jgi:hypothetical protein